MKRLTTPDWETLPPGYSTTEPSTTTRPRHPILGAYSLAVVSYGTYSGIQAFLIMHYGQSSLVWLSAAGLWWLNSSCIKDFFAWLGGER